MNVCINYKCYVRIYESKSIDVNKTDDLHKCIICHWWYFLNLNFRVGPEVCNGCQDLMQKHISFKNVAIVFVKGNDHRMHF